MQTEAARAFDDLFIGKLPTAPLQGARLDKSPVRE